MKNNKAWLRDFKIALIQKDFERLDQLRLVMPMFDNEIQLTEAYYLMIEAINVFKARSKILKKEMDLLIKSMQYLDVYKSGPIRNFTG